MSRENRFPPGWDEERERFDPRSRPRCEFIEGTLYLAHYTIEKLLAEFFEIDLNQAETERRKLLEYVRQTTLSTTD